MEIKKGQIWRKRGRAYPYVLVINEGGHFIDEGSPSVQVVIYCLSDSPNGKPFVRNRDAFLKLFEFYSDGDHHG